jgi:PAS domain S-box-containing protein
VAPNGKLKNKSQLSSPKKVTGGKRTDYYKEESSRLILEPFKSLAFFTSAAGIIALIFEVRFFSQFSTLIYASRVSSVFIAFILLLISNSKLGKKHPVVLVHILLLTIISSFAVMIYLIPTTLVFNSHLISLILFVAALFLSWDVKNQIIVAIYYNLVFSLSIIFNSQNIYILPNMVESVILVIVISIMAIAASYINSRLRQEALQKSFEMTQSEKKFRNIFENTAEGIFQFGLDGNFFTVNPSFLKMLGYAYEDEMLKMNLSSDCFKRKGDWELLLKLLEKQGKVKNYRVLMVKKDGTEITVRMNVRVNYDEETNVTFYEGSCQDITQQVIAENERQKALEALRQEKLKADIAAKKAQQESNYKSKFLANMSHEVRTPMNSVMGFLTLIENDLFEDTEELKNFARDARLAAESLLDIINNILDISKIEAGKMDLDEVKFNLNEELQKAMSIIGQVAKQKNLIVEQKIDEEIPEEIIGDPTRYRQIILNLLSNAVKFTDEGKISLDIKCGSKTEDWIELITTVEDTGHGIPSEKIPLLFEPYVQVKNKKTKKEGTGLGLVISKEFIKLMNGDINVESKIGIGSKFIFNVKMKLKPEAVIDKSVLAESYQVPEAIVEEHVSENENKINQPTKKRILLVEDNPISQNLELKILREVGYDVDAVSTGHEAIDTIKSGIFDLVLMDIEMTDMDGITATKKIRELEGNKSRIPIIAVTAHSSMKDREKCLAAGMDDYIAKPINIHFLKLTIDQWLKSTHRD